MDASFGAASTFGSVGTLPSSPPPAIAPEVVKRLLHEMDTDLDELVRLDDVRAFVAKHKLPFGDVELRAMFDEANYARDGMLDEEQLGKAVSGKFPHRQCNDAWRRLFELTPRPMSMRRLTELPSEQPQQQPIRASYEQEPNIMTFAPQQASSRASLSRSHRSNSPSFSDTQRISAGAAATRPPGSPPTLHPFAHTAGAGERAEEDALNRLLRATTAPSAPSEGGAPAPAAAAPPPVRCGFDAQRTFGEAERKRQDASDNHGWRTRLEPVAKKERELLFGCGAQLGAILAQFGRNSAQFSDRRPPRSPSSGTIPRIGSRRRGGTAACRSASTARSPASARCARRYAGSTQRIRSLDRCARRPPTSLTPLFPRC